MKGIFLLYTFTILHAGLCFGQNDFDKNVIAPLTDQVLLKAENALLQRPIPLQRRVSPRNAGGKQHFIPRATIGLPTLIIRMVHSYNGMDRPTPTTLLTIAVQRLDSAKSWPH